MAGKPTVFASRRFFHALDELSKNALIDLLTDRAQAQVGEEATDEQLAEVLQGWVDTVLRYRNDRPVNLAGVMARLDRTDEDYRNGTGKYTRTERSAVPLPPLETGPLTKNGADDREPDPVSSNLGTL